MNTLREAAQQALEALEAWKDAAPSQWTTRDEKAITDLRAALAQPEPRNQCGETCERAKLCAVCARGLEQQEPKCKGIPRRGCNYLARCDTVCNKCGEIHHHHQMVAQFQAALAQEEQEPVTWGVDWGRDNDQSCCTIIKRHADGTQEVVAVEYGPPRRETEQEPSVCARCGGLVYDPVWVAQSDPPRREWRGLTEEDIWTLAAKHMDTVLGRLHFARAIEALLKEKNHD